MTMVGTTMLMTVIVKKEGEAVVVGGPGIIGFVGRSNVLLLPPPRDYYVILQTAAAAVVMDNEPPNTRKR